MHINLIQHENLSLMGGGALACHYYLLYLAPIIFLYYCKYNIISVSGYSRGSETE